MPDVLGPTENQAAELDGLIFLMSNNVLKLATTPKTTRSGQRSPSASAASAASSSSFAAKGGHQFGAGGVPHISMSTGAVRRADRRNPSG